MTEQINCYRCNEPIDPDKDPHHMRKSVIPRRVYNHKIGREAAVFDDVPFCSTCRHLRDQSQHRRQEQIAAGVDVIDMGEDIDGPTDEVARRRFKRGIL